MALFFSFSPISLYIDITGVINIQQSRTLLIIVRLSRFFLFRIAHCPVRLGLCNLVLDRLFTRGGCFFLRCYW
jgi:hypothetical protein